MARKSRHSLTRLVGAVLEGDQQAWSELVRQLAPTMNAALRRYDVEPEIRADAASEVWRLLFERIENVRDPERLHGWISVVASNQMLSMLRRADYKREVAMADDTMGILHPVVDPDQVVIDEVKAVLEVAVSKLSNREQTVIRCRVLTDEPEPLQTIEQRHGIPAGSVGPTLGRGLTKLRRDPKVRDLLSLRAA